MKRFESSEQERAYYDELDKRNIATWGQHMEYVVGEGVSKVKNAYQSTKEEVSKWYKKEKLVIILVVSLFLYWTFGKWIKQKIGIEEKPIKDGFNVKLKNVEGNAKKSSLSETEAQTMAERLYDAMRYFGTEEEVIFDTLKGLNNNDFSKIYVAFGKRYYNEVFVGGGEAPSWLLGSRLCDLIQWLEFELDLQEKKKLKKLAPELGLF